MPTYQYACTECGHAFEQVQSFTDDALTECPECGGRLRKLFNAVGVVFKGSGFYRTDSRAPSGSSSDSAARRARRARPEARVQSGLGGRTSTATKTETKQRPTSSSSSSSD